MDGPLPRAYYSLFKLPVPIIIVETSTSSMRLNYIEAALITKAQIIWYEATMAEALALFTVNELLKDIMKS